MNYQKVEIKKIEALYDALLSPLIAVLVLSFIIYYSFEGLVQQVHLDIWFGLNLILLTLRILSLIIYKRTKLTSENVSKYYKCFFILSSLSAVVWGSSAFLILPDAIEYKMLILLFITGIVSGAIISLSSKLKIFYVYLFTILLPYLYVFLIEDSHISKAYAFAILLYLIIISSIAKKMSQTLNDNLTLAFEKEDLVQELEIRVEEATAASKAKSDFLSVMSHEIRTPLNAIIGFVNILKKDEKDKTKYKYLDTIDKSSYILTNVINDILDISKIESGKFSLEMSKFNPVEEFDTLYQLFEQNALEKNITLINNISADLPQYLQSDILRIKQIVSNLLSNAIKFTPSGKNVYLNIDFNQETSKLNICVEDEGIGISANNIKLVTQVFTQADNSTARKYGGTGLGLSIVTNLLHLLGSEIKIQSQLDKGSRFSFSIQMESVKDSSDTIKEEQEEKISYPTKKILVAEDNKTNQMLISILLEDMEINTVLADDGLIAEKLFMQEDFDMVLMDINMPNKNGIETMQSMKQYEKKQEHPSTPIIALTANAVSGDRRKYIEDGFDEYIAKPIELEELTKIFRLFFK